MTQPAPSTPGAASAGVFEQEHDALAPGTRLDEFEMLGVLGVGGFGVVYLALDHALERQVAIKEYMPAMLASRGAGAQLRVRSPRHAETYAKGLASFINEAKLLARFDHPSLLKVYRFWEANGTAYMVMPYYPGRTLAEVRLAMPQPPDEAWLRALVEPLLGALDVLHAQGVYHRDIAPDNIVLQPDGVPVLLDFGAARRIITDGQLMTAVLKPNFAPIEQYAEVAHLRQGPWTDLYALGAMLYFVLTGKAPTSAAARAIHDELDLTAAVRGTPAQAVSAQFIAAVSWALAVRPQDRPQSVQALCEALGGAAVPELPPRPAAPPPATMPRLLVDSPWPPTLPYVGRVREPALSEASEHPGGALGDAASADAGASGPADRVGGVDILMPTLVAADADAVAPMPDEKVVAGDRLGAEGGAAAKAAATRHSGPASRFSSRRRWRLGAAAAALGMLALGLGAWTFSGQFAPYAPNLDHRALLPQTVHEGAVPPALASSGAPVTIGAAADEALADAPAAAVSPAGGSGVAALPAHTTEPAAGSGAPPAASRQARSSGGHATAASTKRRATSPAGKARTTASSGPRQLCGDRRFASLEACMRRQCYRPKYEAHAQCEQMRREEERRMLQLVGG